MWPDAWQEIFTTLRANKLRALLTAFGVFWGVFMLVVLLGLGQGLEQGFGRTMSGRLSKAVTIWPERTSLPFDGLQPGREIRFDIRDLELLRAVPGAEFVAPRAQVGGWRGGPNVARGDRAGSFLLSGDVPELALIYGIRVPRGRFVSPLDLRERRKVAVIGPRAHDTLYGPGETAIGSEIAIRGVPFTVVGQLEPIGTGFQAEQFANSIVIPFSTFQQAFNRGSGLDWFALTAGPRTSTVELEARARQVLRNRHNVHPEDVQAINSFNAGQRCRELSLIFVGVRSLVWFVGVCTLLAGAVGVSNIMLIAIKQRTKEIGIRKALGATPWSIVRQIIQESTALTAIAGYLGLTVGVGLLRAIATLVAGSNGMLRNPEIDLRIALAASGVMIAAGVLAGLVPARHAVRITPVEALRAE